MRLGFIILIISFLYTIGKSQLYIIGDTTNMHVLFVNDTIADSVQEIDIDCDNEMDIQFRSHLGGHYYHDWPTLTISMESNTEVAYGKMWSYVSRYETSDTVYLDSIMWAPNWHFIFGVGGAGGYGWPEIDTDFIIFRKTGITDTVYAYFEISTLGPWMNIHRIISTCNIQYLVTQINNYTPQKFIVYPNPFRDFIQCNFPFNELLIFDSLGRTINNIRDERNADLSGLPIGMYILVFIRENGEMIRFKMQKI